MAVKSGSVHRRLLQPRRLIAEGTRRQPAADPAPRAAPRAFQCINATLKARAASRTLPIPSVSAAADDVLLHQHSRAQTHGLPDRGWPHRRPCGAPDAPTTARPPLTHRRHPRSSAGCTSSRHRRRRRSIVGVDRPGQHPGKAFMVVHQPSDATSASSTSAPPPDSVFAVLVEKLIDVQAEPRSGMGWAGRSGSAPSPPRPRAPWS